MWQLFTESARRVILLAQEESRDMGSAHVGTEHLLLGLMREKDGDAAELLKTMGVSPLKVRSEIQIEGPSSPRQVSAEPKLTPKAKRVLENAAAESRRMQHTTIETEHLLLGLLMERTGLAALILERLGLNLNQMRAQVMAHLGFASDEAPLEPAAQAVVDILQTPVRDARLRQQIVRNVSDFVSNLNAGSAFPDNLKYVFEARQGYYGANEWAQNWNQEPRQSQILLQGVNIIEMDDQSAEVTVSYTIATAKPNKAPVIEQVHQAGWTEHLFLKMGQVAGQPVWQIAAPADFPVSASLLQPPLLTQAAFALAQKTNVPSEESQARQSLQQLKKLGLAAIQFCFDFDETFAFAPQYVKDALQPYLASTQTWKIPGTEQSYAFNENLCDLRLNEMNESLRTVLFYEGAAQNLDFRYNGQAAVLFVDGHCVLVSPAQAQDLIWTP